MKKYFAIALLFGALSSLSVNAQVGMMTNNPHKSAQLDLTGTNNKGLLIPNVSLVALNNPAPIVNNAPDTGLMVYNTNNLLPAIGSQPGGTGYFYWDGTKWCRMLTTSNIGSLDNLGSHIATNDLQMSNKNIQNVNKTSTQTESIAQGTDGLLPKPGYVATSTDTAGNIVWRPAPLSVAKDTIAFYKESTGAVSFPSGNPPWTGIPGISSFTYTATGSGTLFLHGQIYAQIQGAASAPVVSAVPYVQITVYNGATLIDQIGSTCQIYSFGTSFFPVKMIGELQIPVIKGVTYTITVQTMISSKAESVAGTGINAPAVIGSLSTAGGGILNSYIMGTLIGLGPLPGGFY